MLKAFFYLLENKKVNETNYIIGNNTNYQDVYLKLEAITPSSALSRSEQVSSSYVDSSS